MLTDKSQILQRWAEHYKDLLNRHSTVDPDFVQDIPELQLMIELDEIPTLQETRDSIASLKHNKAPGPDAIPGEVLRYGGEAIALALHAIIVACWDSGCVPQQWKDGDLISIYKNKGDKSTCDNSRGISLLSCAGKVLARILLMRLISCISENVLPESQCGFRKHRSTNDMIFAIRQIQEKCVEQHQGFYMVFIDLTKAFDTINRPALWEVLKRFGYPPKFLAVLRALHDGAKVRVVGGGEKSEPFGVCTGVRQGCVVASVIFNLFLAAVMLAARRGIFPEDGISINHRLEGSLFNLRRLRALGKVEKDVLLELQYADDAAVIGSSPWGLQRSLNQLKEMYSRAGLVINTDKTEAMVMGHLGEERCTFKVGEKTLKNVHNFRYLGSIINDRGNITDEVQRRIALAASSFGKLSDRIPVT